jgi:hypothetical protein
MTYRVGSPSSKGLAASQADLLKAVQDHTLSGSPDRQSLSGGVQDFIASLPANQAVIVQTIDLTGAPGQPITIKGAQGARGAPVLKTGTAKLAAANFARFTPAPEPNTCRLVRVSPRRARGSHAP